MPLPYSFAGSAREAMASHTILRDQHKKVDAVTHSSGLV